MTDVNLMHELGDTLYSHQWSLGRCHCEWVRGEDSVSDHVDHQAQRVINHLRDLGMVL